MSFESQLLEWQDRSITVYRVTHKTTCVSLLFPWQPRGCALTCRNYIWDAGTRKRAFLECGRVAAQEGSERGKDGTRQEGQRIGLPGCGLM